jgi:hypothetical protein
MKKISASPSIHSSVRLASLLIVVVIFTASCRFPGFGEQPPCGESVLQIADHAYQIKEIKTKADAPINVPTNSPDSAYWINETNVNYVFALSPTENNVALQNSLQEGDTATVTWENCNTATYKLSAPQAAVPDDAVLLDQNKSGITIFIPDGFVITGEVAEETISVFNTPDASELLAEISLLGVSSPADKNTVQIEISILNSGQSAFTFLPDNVSLTPENAAPLSLTGAEPSLPYEIKPAETVIFHLIFPRPSSQTATLKVLDVEYEVEGY